MGLEGSAVHGYEFSFLSGGFFVFSGQEWLLLKITYESSFHAVQHYGD